MTDLNYFEIIKNKLDALVDKIVQKENSDESFRITYAQILEKINTKMDVFSQNKDTEEAINNLNFEVKNLISEKNDVITNKFEAVKIEFEHLNDILEGSLKTDEISELINELQFKLQTFASEINKQKTELDNITSVMSELSTQEQTNAILDRKFDTLKKQNESIFSSIETQTAITKERSGYVLEQLEELQKKSEDFDTKFTEIVTDINQDLQLISEAGNTFANKDDILPLNEKIEDISTELSNTSEIVNCFGNNLSKLIDTIDTNFNFEKLDNITNNIGQILVNITFMSEAIKAFNTDILSEQIADRSKDEFSKYNNDIIHALETKISEKLNIEEIKEIKDYSEKLFYQGTEVLKEELWTLKDIILDKGTFSEKLQTTKDEIIDVLSEESVVASGERRQISSDLVKIKDEIIDVISEESLAISNDRKTIIDNLDKIHNITTENTTTLSECKQIAQNLTNAKDEIIDVISEESIASTNEIKLVSGDINKLKNDIIEVLSANNTISVETQNKISQEFKNLKDEIIKIISENNIQTANTTNNSLNEISDIKSQIFEKIEQKSTVSPEQLENTQKELVESFNVVKDNLYHSFDAVREELTDYVSEESVATSNQLKDIETKLAGVIETAKDNVSFIKETLSNDNEAILKNIKAIEEKVEQNKNEFSDLLFSDGVRTNSQIQTISEAIEKFKTELHSLTETINKDKANDFQPSKAFLNEALESLQKKFVSQVIQIADNISFADEAEDIHTHIDSSFEEFKDKISNDIYDIKAEFSAISDLSSNNDKTLELLETINENLVQSQEETLGNLIREIHLLATGSTNGSDTGYAYTLPDVESDLSKIRLDLSNIIRNLAPSELAENDDIYSNLNALKKSVENIEKNPVNNEISQVKNLFDTLNDDISSISKRTNKLIISSDEVNKTLQGHVNEFTKIVKDFETHARKFQDSNYVINLIAKIDNLTKLCGSILSTDKVLNEAFMYMAEWIDSMSESFNQMKTDVSVINETIIKSDSTENIMENLDRLAAKIEKQQKNIATLEDKVDEVSAKRVENPETKAMIEFIASQINSVNEKLSDNSDCNDKLAQKLENLEKQIKKIEKNVNMLAAYVEED